jgi:hypothetical protein
MLLGCATAGPTDFYVAAVMGYTQALQSQWEHYKALCQVPSESCDKWAVNMRDQAMKAETVKMKADMVVQGLNLPEVQCNEAELPGCSERLRMEFIISATNQLTLFTNELLAARAF